MDIFAHACWTAAAAKITGDKTHRPLRLGWAAFWGAFPDLFTFTIPAVLRIWWYTTGTTHSLLPDPQSARRLQFAWQLYHCSHSLLIFAAIFTLVWAILRLIMHPATPPELHLEFSRGFGPDYHYHGTLSADGQVIAGEWGEVSGARLNAPERFRRVHDQPDSR